MASDSKEHSLSSGEIKFSQLPTAGGAIVDLSSFVSFAADSGFLFSPPEIERSVTRGHEEAQQTAFLTDAATFHHDALRLLESIVVQECLVLDATALEDGGYLKWEPVVHLLKQEIFRHCYVPKEVSESLHAQLLQYQQAMGICSSQILPLTKSRAPIFEGTGASIAPSSDMTTVRYHESKGGFARTFFYLCLGKLSLKPLIVAGDKQAELQQLGAWANELVAGHHDSLSEHARSKAPFASKTPFTSQSPFAAKWSAPLPPVVDMSIRLSIRERISPWQAAWEIRRSPHAVAYRSMIDDLTRSSWGNLNTRLLADAKVAEIKKLMDDWSKQPDQNFRGQVRYLNLQKIPAIGWLAEALNILDRIPVRDFKISDQDPGLAFVADWFQPYS